MPRTNDARLYIVLPSFGFTSPVLAQSSALRKQPGTVTLEARPARRESSSRSASATRIQIIHSMREDGPKLVEMTAEAELNLRVQEPSLKIVPLVYYRKMRSQAAVEKVTAEAGRASCKVTDALTGKPVQGAHCVAFTSYRYREGAEGVSNAAGIAHLQLPTGARIERLYVYPPAMYWGSYATGFDLSPNHAITLQPIDLTSQAHLLGEYTRGIPIDAGKGIRVGVIDSGIAKAHPALPNVEGGSNHVTEEVLSDAGAETEWGPAAEEGEHGTHVAGIIGMQSIAGSALRGVAPGASIRSYRVFPNQGKGATNYDIIKAINRAVADGCHIINLSLGGGDPDEAVRAALGMALDKGTIAIVAAGNDGRGPVSYPAAWPASLAVSAMGRKGTFPADSVERSEIAAPYGSPDKDAFIAAFSNYGPQITVTGPGVGIVSALPDTTYGVMSGTSMACPAIAGFAAYLLAKDPAMLAMTGPARCEALKQALTGSARIVGFGRDYEGFGLPLQEAQV